MNIISVQFISVIRIYQRDGLSSKNSYKPSGLARKISINHSPKKTTILMTLSRWVWKRGDPQFGPLPRSIMDVVCMSMTIYKFETDYSLDLHTHSTEPGEAATQFWQGQTLTRRQATTSRLGISVLTMNGQSTNLGVLRYDYLLV